MWGWGCEVCTVWIIPHEQTESPSLLFSVFNLFCVSKESPLHGFFIIANLLIAYCYRNSCFAERNIMIIIIRRRKIIVRLSLLTMTNLNHMREILFVYSKMADQTNSSSKLSVADGTTEVRARQLCWWCLSSALRCVRFCSASLILFASYSLAPLLVRPRYFARSCAICSHDSVSMLKSLREALRVSLYRFF